MSEDPISRLNAALEGRYRVERELGEGGMATVYLADDIKHERKVAPACLIWTPRDRMRSARGDVRTVQGCAHAPRAVVSRTA